MVNPYPLDLAASAAETQSVMDGIAAYAAEWREASRNWLLDGGFILVVPWYAVEFQGGWEPFCEYFTGFTRRTLTSPPIAGCESIDPDGKSHRFTIPPRQEQ